MPLVVYLLALAVFTQGTSEFMVSGLLPAVAADLDVPVATAGLLTSAFAVGMVVGAPVMAVLGMRLSRRHALTAFLMTFVAVHVVGAVATSYPLLLATRVVGALANAGFWATALATATAVVAPGLRGRATSVVIGGVTVANVAGVPAGALLGQLWGWRSTFWAVALLSLPAIVAIWRSVPSGAPGSTRADVRTELRAVGDRRAVTTLVLAVLVNGATFCTLTFLAPLVTSVTGLGEIWVPVVLVLFGLGSFTGVTIGARLADAHPVPLLATGMLALLAGWVTFALAAGSPAVVVVLVFVQGALAFATGSTLVARVFQLAPAAPNLAGGLATSSFNVGAAVGPWLGGLGMATAAGLRAPLWVSALLTAAAVVVAGVGVSLLRARMSVARRTDGQPVP